MTLKQLLGIVNIRVQVVSLSPLVLGTLTVIAGGRPLKVPEAVLLALAALAIGLGTSAYNTCMDFLKGVDSEKYEQDPDRVLVTDGVEPGAALLTALALFGIGLVSGLLLSLLVGPELILVGIFSVAVAVFYSSGPFPLSRTPLGEVFAALTQGTLLFCLTWYVQTRTLPPEILYLSLPSACFVALVLAVNNNCDLVGDKAAGRHTLSILLGHRWSRLLAPALCAAGYAFALGAVLNGLLKPWAAAILFAGAAGSVPLVFLMDRRGYSHGTKAANMGTVLFLFNLFTVVMASALVFSHLVHHGAETL